MMMLGNVDRREIKMQEMDTYIVVIPSPAFCIIFHLLHSNKKDIGENADIAIESMNLCSFQITIRLRYLAQISGKSKNSIYGYSSCNRAQALYPFYERSRPRPKMLEVIESDRL